MKQNLTNFSAENLTDENVSAHRSNSVMFLVGAMMIALAAYVMVLALRKKTCGSSGDAEVLKLQNEIKKLKVEEESLLEKNKFLLNKTSFKPNVKF